MIRIVSFLMLLCVITCSAQHFSSRTFIDTRIVNGQSVETNASGIAKFIISHRFGRLNTGAYELFGLDESTIRIGLDYGVTDFLTVGLGRSSFQKTYDGFAKVRWLRQSHGERQFPFTVSSFHSTAINTLRDPFPQKETEFSERVAYVHQLLIARKVNDDLSIQLMPSFVHRNLVIGEDSEHDILSLGGAVRYQVAKHWALSAEYYHDVLDRLDPNRFNPIALGVEIETRGHVFQFQFGNARGMIENYFIAETAGDVTAGDIHFGFNITRDFKLRGRKYQ